MSNLRRLILLPVTCGLALLAVSGSASAATTFTNPAPITNPGSGPSGPATPYPSSISVSGLTGPVTGVTVTLHRFGHTNPRDADILLVSPSGDNAWVMENTCGDYEGDPGDDDIEDFTWIFSQAAPGPMPEAGPCDAFVYRPTSRGITGINFHMPSPAPPGPYGKSFNDFNNENPNGTWQLFARDRFEGFFDTGPGVGDIEQGWSLGIETGPSDAVIPGTGTSGVANPYPITRSVSGQTGVITDLDVVLNGAFHQRPDDLDLLLVGPSGEKVVLMSDACGSFDVNAYGWRWDDEAAAPMPDGGSTNDCGTSNHRPTDHEPGESWPSPAPAGPHGTSLSAFDLTDPNGDWRLFVRDDQSGEVGFFTSRFFLQMTTRPKADVAFAEGAVEVAEGKTRALTLTRSGPATLGAGAVKVTSAPVTATPGGDFTPLSSVVEFAPGETQKTVQVSALADPEREPNEQFLVTIGSPTGDAKLAEPSSVTVTIPGQVLPDPPAPPAPDPPAPPAPVSPDRSAPQTTITKHPPRKTAKRKARFAFKANEPASFKCKLDRKRWKACSSPKAHKRLKPGKHVFRVRATDEAGNTDPTPAKRKWKLKTKRNGRGR